MPANRFYDPFPQKFNTTTGSVGAGWKLYFYVGGSSTTLQDTYSDTGLSVPNTNPVVADSAGLFGDIFLDSGLSYAVKLTDGNDVQIDYASYIQQATSTQISQMQREVQAGSAASGQVFTLTSFTYSVGDTQNLLVFQNGDLLEPGPTNDYEETSSSSITVNSAITINPGDKWTFLKNVASATVANAANITYTPAGSGAVATNVQAKLRETVSVTDFGAVGDGVTDDLSALNLAVTYCKANNKALFFPELTFAISDTLNVTDGNVQMYGNYNPYTNRGSCIKFIGSSDANASVVEYHANTAAILASGVHGIRLDSNNLAGRALTLRATSAALKHFYLDNFYLGGFTARGIDLVGSAGGSELAECYYNNGEIYSANTSAAGYGVYSSTGTNISFHRFNNVKINGDSSDKLKNCAYFSTGGGFYFNDCLFAQTVAQTSTDGYVAYSAGGFVQFDSCWNEADGWLYMGNANTAQAVTSLVNCHDSNPATYDVFFNTQYHHLNIRGCSFNNNIYLGANTNIGGVSIDAIKFAAGKGVIDASSSSSDPATNWGSREDPKATYTYTSGTLTLNQFAKVHEITLEASITTLNAPGSTSNELQLIFIQDGVGSHTVGFGTSFGFAGGSAPTITAAAGSVDIISFQRLTGALNFIETARSQNIS